MSRPSSTESPFGAADRAERALLASVLRYPLVLDDVLPVVLSADYFRADAHQKVWRVLLSLHGQSDIDLVSVAEGLRIRGWLEDVGGAVWLADLFDSEPTGVRASHYARLVRGEYLRRSLAALAGEMLREAQNPTCEPLEALTGFERKLWTLTETGCDGEAEPLSLHYDSVLDALDRRDGGGGLLTGFTDLDAVLGGLRPGELVVLAARPSIGKTACALTIMRHLTVRQRVPVFFASLEQSPIELAQRNLAAQAGVSLHDLRAARLPKAQAVVVTEAWQQLRPAPLYVDGTPGQPVLRLAANARRAARRYKVRAVFVDYLQLVRPEDPKAQRYEQIGQITRRLKQTARELEVPVIALAQLNRNAEERARPRLSDLREGGDQEQDADKVLLLHKPEDTGSEVIPVEVIVAKHRNGPTGLVKLAFRKATATFENMAFDPNF